MAFVSILIVLPYLIFEVSVSLLYVKGIIEPPSSFWIFEETGKTIQFDPIRGYKLTSIPSRHARITNGVIEYEGVFHGNSQGFPDRDDFSPVRGNATSFRIAVFGDSLTAGLHLKKNWPDAVEDLSRQKGVPIELLNFSVDGGGLANWWSIVTRIIQNEDYEIDSILFAVLGDNLRRGFTISEHRGYQRHMFARMSSWDPEQWPKTLEEARPHLRARSGYIVSSVDFEQALKSKRYLGEQRNWYPYIAKKIVKKGIKLCNFFFKSSSSSKSSSPSKSSELFEPARINLIKQIAHFAQTKALPVLVVEIPSRSKLIQRFPNNEETLQFASILNANFVDGSKAFIGLTEKEIRANWLPYDGHWGQSGSNRFAAFMFDVLQKWSREYERK